MKVYDDLKKSIFTFREVNIHFLNSENSPSKVVGFRPSKNFKKITTQCSDAVFSKCF